jgi:hypothetical protein
MTEEIEPEPGIAQPDQVCARVRQRNDAGLVLDQRLDPAVNRVEEAADQAGVQILFEAQVKQYVKRIAPNLARDVGDRTVGQPGIFRLYRCSDDDPLPVALKDRPRFRIVQIDAEALAEARVAEHSFELLAVSALIGSKAGWLWNG